MKSIVRICALFTTTILFAFNNVTANSIGMGGPTRMVTEGKDALLTCVIMGSFANDTVLWKRGNNDIIAAGTSRVTNDRRFRVLHDETPKGKTPNGGDVWVLLITDTKPSDSDLYVCEVNSDPPIKSFHSLRVKALNSTSKSLIPKKPIGGSTAPLSSTPSISETDADDADADDDDDDESVIETEEFVHDFSDCCKSANVTEKCLGFCNIHNIIDGTAGVEPDVCEADFPRIVRCMADGRNHLPCCEQKKIPDVCQDMCQGEYTPFTDYVRSRVSCVAYTLPALKCILEGVENIPSPPENIVVEPLNENSLQVNWSPPARLPHRVRSYNINCSVLHSFDEASVPNITSEVSVTVTADLDSAVINNLKPFTMYSITMTSSNNYGSSLPSVRVRALTLDSGISTKPSVAVVPVLPDVRGCCIRNGMSHRVCVDKMCDPKKADYTQIPDLMVCAPWANITFSCLANKIDHTPCCKSRGIPDSCLSFCSGTVTTITFQLFRCLQYMSEYSSCLLQGYGVLAGAPTRIKAPLIASRFAIIEWNAPKILPETVISYNVHLRKMNTNDEFASSFTVMEKDHPPVILEDLDSNTFYEAFVVAVNAHGNGPPSTRLVFKTKLQTEFGGNSNPSIAKTYNITNCCKAASILPQCMPLCSYDIKVSDLQLLGQACSLQMGSIAKCASGGRDHIPCCTRRGVINRCLPLCQGKLPQPPVDCIAYGGNIIQCFEEGTENIPGPVENLHATLVTKSSISLEWIPNEEDSNHTSTSPNSKKTKKIDFVVQYGKVNNMTLYETVVKMENEMNTTDNDIELTNLESDALYRVLVFARNEHGTSLPSAMLLINTTDNVKGTDSSSFGVPSPPHSLSISAHSATYVTINWQPPEYSHLHEAITYHVFHKATADNETFSLIETRLTYARITNLKPNSQHVVYITAIGRKGESLPSETLVVWTDPALPAIVEPPAVQPNDKDIPEGGQMTIFCLALGNPVPTISLYIGGHLVRQEIGRHMVTTIQNVSKDMESVICYASNGYGIPTQASRKIRISYAPRIQPSGITLALLGERVELKCIVKARPAPKVIFWRDHEGHDPVPLGSNYEMTTDASSDDISQTTMTLSILRLTNEMAGEYFCHASNDLGFDTRAVSVRVRNTPPAHNVSMHECCIAQNVSSACMDACSFYIDFDSVKNRPECLVDFDKLMKCASDGSDHRSCCANGGVPRYCLNWCRGEALNSLKSSSCVLQHTKTIIDCFQNNRDRLPSQPLNLAVLVVSNSEALIKWDPPTKNPQMVEGYRVYWHEVEPTTENNPINSINGIGTYRVDTKETNIRIGDLRPNIIYELVVKAGNQFGSSVLTDPIKFQLGQEYITSASGGSSGSTGAMLGIFAGIIVIALATVALLLYRRKITMKTNSNGGVSFENPSYLREVNMENVQISALSSSSGGNDSMNWRSDSVPATTVATTAASSHPNDHAMTNITAATEVNPSLYDELKLGYKGATGFKRLVS